MKKVFLTVLCLAVLCLTACLPARAKDISAGFGIGPAHGIFGANAEMLFDKNMSVSGGIGNPAWAGTDSSGIWWMAGGRYYFGEPTENPRMRAGLFYGKVAEYIVSSASFSKSYYGFYPAIGFQWKFSDFISFDADAGYLMRDIDDTVTYQSGGSTVTAQVPHIASTFFPTLALSMSF